MYRNDTFTNKRRMNKMSERKQAIKIVAASLLGDGNIHRDNGTKNGRFQLTQIPEHKDHAEYVASFLEFLTAIRRTEYSPKEDIIICGKKTRSKGRYMIVTRNHPFYTKVYNRWYGTGRKSIDPHYLKLMDFEMLAVWYQQDGSLGVKNKCMYKRPLFMTDCFSLSEVQLLSKAVYEKLNIITSVIKNRKKDGSYYYRLAVSSKSVVNFVNGVRPFIQPSFEYKLDIY